MNLRGDWRTQEELEGKWRNRNDINIVLACRISKRKRENNATDKENVLQKAVTYYVYLILYIKCHFI